MPTAFVSTTRVSEALGIRCPYSLRNGKSNLEISSECDHSKSRRHTVLSNARSNLRNLWLRKRSTTQPRAATCWREKLWL